MRVISKPSIRKQALRRCLTVTARRVTNGITNQGERDGKEEKENQNKESADYRFGVCIGDRVCSVGTLHR